MSPFAKTRKTVSVISFGCPKNLADSEALARKLGARGLEIEPDPSCADIIVVNTCGFVEDAKKESIAGILEAVALKAEGKRLVVMGCLAKRHGDELIAEVPEIDALFGVGEEDSVARWCARQGGQGGAEALMDLAPAAGDTTSILLRAGRSEPSVPVKVAEGCDRSCTYCVIPSIRGPFHSRRPEEILAEAERYVAKGARELVLVAQDLTSYGREFGGYGLPELLADLSAISGEFWVRPLYFHPASITEKLLRAMHEETKVTKYVDMPLQHSEDSILRYMGRGGTRRKLLELVGRVRESVPGVALRTTFIVGFPGEGEAEFQGMLGFIEEARFERLGVFMYSKEKGTPAARMKGHVPKRVKQSRYGRAMSLQCMISLDRNRELIGRTMRVLIEEPAGDRAVGRISTQAPEIDGVTFVTGRGLRRGEFVQVLITRAGDYDLEGEAI